MRFRLATGVVGSVLGLCSSATLVFAPDVGLLEFSVVSARVFPGSPSSGTLCMMRMDSIVIVSALVAAVPHSGVLVHACAGDVGVVVAQVAMLPALGCVFDEAAVVSRCIVARAKWRRCWLQPEHRSADVLGGLSPRPSLLGGTRLSEIPRLRHGAMGWSEYVC